MPTRLGLLFLLGFGGWVSIVRADELERVAGGIQAGLSSRGVHSDFTDDPIGRFMDLVAEGALAEARSLQPQVCAAWSRGRTTSPFSGRFFVSGVELSLDRLCGPEPTLSR